MHNPARVRTICLRPLSGRRLPFSALGCRPARLAMVVAARHATEVQHHPRLMNMWRTVTVWLSTWDAGHRITLLDIEFARYLDRKFKDF